MTAYIVRLQDDHEIVGFFDVPNIATLYDAIDECCDPLACEFAATKFCGFYFPRRTQFTVPMPFDEDADEAPEFPHITLNGYLLAAAYDGVGAKGQKLSWRAFDPSEIFDL